MIIGSHRIKMVNSLGNDIPFYWDPISEEWLSINENIIQLGRRTIPGGGVFLRNIGGAVGKALGNQLFNPHSAWDSVITWVSGRAKNTPNCTLELYYQNSVIYSKSWTTAAFTDAPFTLITAFNISGKIATGAVQGPSQPIVLIGIRWRLT